ncbi:MAG: glycosyltransferase family 4 protein [Phycisphaeraceae bacterium]|nr:glycosyltransferase family 4 protein [Phycisphaeraceae bacterium]
MHPERIADTLVLTFTHGVSLRTWVQTGGIARELALYERLAPHFDRVILVTYGGPGDPPLLAEHASPALAQRAVVICNRDRLDLNDYVQALPALVADLCHPGSSAIVKTNQMQGGHAALDITNRLRSLAVSTGLIARGGYLWTRMLAYEHGASSHIARRAAEEEGALCTHADVVVGTTADMTDDLAWRYALNHDRVRVIPNYVVAQDVNTPVRTAAQREPATLLYAGQLVHRKRVDVLIDAVARLTQDQGAAAAVLEIIGDGPDRAPLMAQARALNAPVRFVGRLHHLDLLERMRACAVYMQASEMEGHPKTILEAMACGAPVIVADTPGQSGVVAHGLTGLKLPLDSAAFAQAAAALLTDPDWRDTLGGAAARESCASLSLDAILPLELSAHRAATASARDAQRDAA